MFQVPHETFQALLLFFQMTDALSQKSEPPFILAHIIDAWFFSSSTLCTGRSLAITLCFTALARYTSNNGDFATFGVGRFVRTRWFGFVAAWTSICWALLDGGAHSLG